MSFPDHTPPPHPFTSSPFSGGDAAGFWPPFWAANDDHHRHHQQPDLISQFDNRPPFKKSRTSEPPQNFGPFPPASQRTNPPNVPGGNKGTSHIFYKTRMCAKFIDGTCLNGENCTFAHGANDLREPPPNWQEIIREKDRVGSGFSNNWGGGGSSSGAGDDHRMYHRMKICKKYYNGEECPYGDKCNFLHERPSPPVKRFKVDNVEERESSAINVGITSWDDRGSGGSDFDQKVFWKTKMCSKWEMGHCPFRERCHYAHGQSELKYSGKVDEAEQVVMNAAASSSIPRNPSVSTTNNTTFSTAPPNLGVVAPINGDGENNKASRWKVTKKINRIYGDWLDDATPPYCSPSQENI